MARISDLLPNLYAVSFSKPHAFWSSEEKWEEPFFPAALIYYLETELENTNGNVDLMITRASAFVNDIIIKKGVLQEKLVVLNFLQFQAASVMLSYLAKNKYFPYCFDWITNSVSEEVSVEKKRDFFAYRIGEMIVSDDPYIKSTFNDIFANWTGDLFYYSRCTGGHNELVKVFLDTYFNYFIKISLQLKTQDFAYALSQLTSWCYNHKLVEQQVRCNKALYEIYGTAIDPKLKKMIAFHFSCARRNDTGKTRREWCQIVLKDYYLLLVSHEKFQILVNQFENDIELIHKNFELLIETIKNYVDELSQTTNLLNAYHRSRIFSLLEWTILTLASNREIEKANQIFSVFFSIPFDKLIRPNNGYFIPNAHQGVIYCFANQVLTTDTDSSKNLPVIVALENDFLGNTHTFNDNTQFVLEAPSREGVPDPEYANKFYTALSEHLKVSKLLEYGHLTRCNGYFLVYGTQLAMQPIISKEIGLTLPIIHSFYEPLKAKELKRVFVWQGYTQLAELHRIGVEEVFKSFNVEVIWLTCFDSNKEEFLEHYSGEDYDIFWILGHGEFMHHESHNSYIDLGNEIKVTITEVSSIQFQSTERRLLILDACDGATTSLANNPAAIGLGSSMVSAHQSLISHGWPVENVSSMILGIILSIFLGQGYTYSEAHQKTISKFYEGKDNVLELFRQFNINEDIIERIVNKDFDYSNFYYWGSLVHVI